MCDLESHLKPPIVGTADLQQRWLGRAKLVCRAGFDFIYPPACPLCIRPHEWNSDTNRNDSGMCDDCFGEVAGEISRCCLRCGAPVGPHVDTSVGCFHCHRDKFRFAKVYALGVYEGLMQRACLFSKERHGKPLAASMAKVFWGRKRDELSRESIDLIVPVPQHWTRRLYRLHNPAETLAEVLSRRLKVDFSAHILAKVRRTPTQLNLPPHQRRSNLRGAFRVRGGRILAGGSVLLVDDILTTGTTANETAKVLRRAGADRVVVAVLARGIGK